MLLINSTLLEKHEARTKHFVTSDAQCRPPRTANMSPHHPHCTMNTSVYCFISLLYLPKPHTCCKLVMFCVPPPTHFFSWLQSVSLVNGNFMALHTGRRVGIVVVVKWWDLQAPLANSIATVTHLYTFSSTCSILTLHSIVLLVGYTLFATHFFHLLPTYTRCLCFNFCFIHLPSHLLLNTVTTFKPVCVCLQWILLAFLIETYLPGCLRFPQRRWAL